MHTAAARRSFPADLDDPVDTVFALGDRRSGGWRHARDQVDARRWQRVGRAIVAHNGRLTERERWRAGLLNAGPRAVVTSFTAAQADGLTGWNRRETHLLVPSGTHVPPVPGLRLKIHFSARWGEVQEGRSRGRHALPRRCSSPPRRWHPGRRWDCWRPPSSSSSRRRIG